MGFQQILLGMGAGFAGDPSGITATGGTMYTGQKNDDGTPYTWHVFPGGPRGPESPMPYSFDVTAVDGPGKVEYICFGGGGMGGISPNPDPGANPYLGAGGGGSGGFLCNFTSPPIAPSPESHTFAPWSPGPITATVQTYPVVVGRAAAGNPAPERTGKPSSVFGVTAYGGGNGGHASGPSPNTDAGPGGAGGGAGQPPGSSTPGTGNVQGGGPRSTTPSGTPRQGSPGGTASGSSTGYAGGGGGAFQSGQASGSTQGSGGGGAAFSDTGYYKIVPGFGDQVGGSRYFCGGGGAGSHGGNEWDPYGNTGKGGSGGGGDGYSGDGAGVNADQWTGGGGGGAGGGPTTRNGGQGGQGMVFIRYVD